MITPNAYTYDYPKIMCVYCDVNLFRNLNRLNAYVHIWQFKNIYITNRQLGPSREKNPVSNEPNHKCWRRCVVWANIALSLKSSVCILTLHIYTYVYINAERILTVPENNKPKYKRSAEIAMRWVFGGNHI